MFEEHSMTSLDGIKLFKKRLLLTSREAAAQLSICERKLFSLKESGEIPAIRIGRSVRFSLSDLEKFVESHKH